MLSAAAATLRQRTRLGRARAGLSGNRCPTWGDGRTWVAMSARIDLRSQRGRGPRQALRRASAARRVWLEVRLSSRPPYAYYLGSFSAPAIPAASNGAWRRHRTGRSLAAWRVGGAAMHVRLAQVAIRGDAGCAMKHNKSARQRCIECRRWFHASASARETQRVCCEGCRKRRDRELARARRERDLDGHREDERERQRKCRRARGEKLGSGPVRVTGCHAPASCWRSGRFYWDRCRRVGQEPPCHAPP